MRHSRFLIALMVPFTLSAISACTSVKGTVTHACDTTRSSLATGLNHPANTVLDGGDSDGKWIVIRDPDPATTEPREATVITTHAWAPAQAGSQWIGPYPPGEASAENIAATPPGEIYSYLYCFCLCDQSRLQLATLQGALRADNQATVYLNDVEILPQTAIDTFNASKFPQPVAFVANPNLIRGGLNCLQVDVKNQIHGRSPTGINVTGTIIKTACCQGRTSRPTPPTGKPDPMGQPPANDNPR